MKIVHAVRSEAFAGVERHVAVLATAQHKAGRDVAVIGGDPHSMRSNMPAGLQWLPGASTVQVARSLLEVRHAAVVHAHMTAAEAAAVAATSAGVPIVATRHFASRRGRSVLGRIASPMIRSRMSAQIAVSQYVADHVDGEATVVYPGVSTSWSGSTQRKHRILAAQRLEAEKGVDVVIRAFARSAAPAEGWRLVIAGEGSLRNDLEELARSEGVEPTVDFLGHRSDVMDLMAGASLFASGCPVEGLGLAVVEAMAMGLPVVATASGGHLETVGSVTHEYLFQPGDDEAAASRINALVSNPGVRHSYGRALEEQQRARFTPEQQERGTMAVYESVCR